MEFILANWIYILIAIGLLSFFTFAGNQIRLMLKDQRQTFKPYQTKRT